MVADGYILADNGVYPFPDPLPRRRQQRYEASSARWKEWDESWEMAIVTAPVRPLTERVALRKSMVGLRLAELREGVWIRPDNLLRQPDRTVAEQYTFFVSRYPDPLAWSVSCGICPAGPAKHGDSAPNSTVPTA
jgi:phenylacetic acid degradation operon negative regulatory protein